MSETGSNGKVGVVSTYHLAIFDDNLRSLPLTAGTLLVGRSKGNHLQLHDHLLSRKHCSLTLSAGRLTLVDLNSSNGTYVNGDRIGTRDLVTDDIIELGKTVLVLFDGETWKKGRGLLNLRNPLKAQELVQILQQEANSLQRVTPRKLAGADNGIRARKGLTEVERAFMRWLERGENRLLPELVTDYLTHKLVSLLVRNSNPVRAAFTSVLEEMMRPEFFSRFGETRDLHAAISQLVSRELNDLRHEEEAPAEERDLLEPEDELEGGRGESPEETPAIEAPEEDGS